MSRNKPTSKNFVTEELMRLEEMMEGDEILEFANLVKETYLQNKSKYNEVYIALLSESIPYEEYEQGVFCIMGDRRETDEEFNLRVKEWEEEQSKEYKEFLRLKEKYEGDQS